MLGRATKEAEHAQEQAVSSTPRTAATLLFAVGGTALGVLMLVVDDVAWPVWDDTVDSLWSPVTGSVMIVTSLILATTTILTRRNAGGGARSPQLGEMVDLLQAVHRGVQALEPCLELQRQVERVVA